MDFVYKKITLERYQRHMSNLYKNVPHENKVKNNKTNFSDTKLGAFSMNNSFLIRLYNLIF